MNIAQTLKDFKLIVKKADKKDALIRLQNDAEFQAALQYRFNPWIDINLTTKELRTAIKQDQHVHTLSELNAYCEQVHPKEQRRAVAQGYLNQFSGDDKDLMQSLLTKELALGVGVKTVNQVYGKVIPEFNVQLAYPFAKKINQYSDDDVFYVTQKLDGHRNLTTIEPTKQGVQITFFSRTGQIRTGMDQLRNNLLEWLSDNQWVSDQFPNGLALDGELLANNDEGLTTVELFQKTSDILQQEADKYDLHYNVFDVIPLEEFNGNTNNRKDYTYRRENWLNQMTNQKYLTIIPVLAKITKQDIPTWSDYATAHGWEGVMLNLAAGVYKKKRSNQLLKVKKMHTADLPIIGFNFDGDYLQTINVRLDEHNVVSVGSGLTDALRAEITQNQDKYIDTMCEVQYFEEMKDRTGKTLRFPVFKDFRFDKTPEDINIE